MAEMGCLCDLCKACNAVWKWSMVPERKRDGNFMKIGEIHSEAVCGVQLKDRVIAKNFMLMIGMNKTVDQLAMANSARWYGHVLRMENGHALWGALDFEVEGHGKKGRPKRTWKNQVEEESIKAGVIREDALCRSKWIVAVNLIATRLRWIWPPSFVVDTTKSRHWFLASLSYEWLQIISR